MATRRLLLFAAAWVLLSAPASAHTENSDGYSTIRVEANRLSYDLFLDYFEFARAVRLGVGRGAPRPALREALDRARGDLAAHLGKRLTVALDGVDCQGLVAGTDVERRLDREYAHIRLEFSCPGAHAGRMLVRYGLLFDDSDPSHRNLVTYEADGKQAQFVFTAAQRELRLGEGSAPGQALRFIELGVHHILSGYDHVLFVIALLLATTSLTGVLRVLSVFTLAHSITLAAALLKVARFPPDVVEPLIALSIAYVAVESFSPAASRWRLPVVFGFGLVHGMGFAGALQITGAKGWALAAPLVSFNLGIELGQGLLVLLVYPVLVLARKLSWSRLLHGVAQGAISAIGLLWYFQRLAS